MASGHVDSDSGIHEAGADRPPAAPGAPAAPGMQPGQPGGVDTRVDVRVYNNSPIKGLAKQAGDDLRKRGWNVTKVDNFDKGRVATSTVFYRPGTPEEAAAKTIAQQFGLHVEKRFSGIKKASDGVIVIVTQDFRA